MWVTALRTNDNDYMSLLAGRPIEDVAPFFTAVAVANAVMPVWLKRKEERTKDKERGRRRSRRRSRRKNKKQKTRGSPFYIYIYI